MNRNVDIDFWYYYGRIFEMFIIVEFLYVFEIIFIFERNLCLMNCKKQDLELFFYVLVQVLRMFKFEIKLEKILKMGYL